MRTALTLAKQRALSWLDWEDVAVLVVGTGKERRGALLNGGLDYDNLDNVGRFLQGAELGAPAYDTRQLARALRLMPTEALLGAHAGDAPHEPVFLLAEAEQDGLAWQGDRARVYGFLEGDHRNIERGAMLRKAAELAYADQALPLGFLDMTDDEALYCLAASSAARAASIARHVAAGAGQRYVRMLEANVPRSSPRARRSLSGGRGCDVMPSWRVRRDWPNTQ